MWKLCLSLGGGAVSAAFAVVVAKAQKDPSIWYSWILQDPHVVPGLLTFSALCFAVALGQWRPIRDLYWWIFVRLFAQVSKSRDGVVTSRLQIHSATWWNERKTVSRDVLKEVKERLAVDGWVFRVDTFGSIQDPEDGDDHKFVEIDYTFDGWPRKVSQWKQRAFVILPEAAEDPKKSTITPVEPKITVTIRDSVVERIPSDNLVYSEIRIFLRVAVINHKLPATKLYDWKLDLCDETVTVPMFLSGTGAPVFERLLESKFKLAINPPAQTSRPDHVDKWLDVVSQSEPLAPGIGESGWVMFRFPDRSLYHAFGHTYRLQVRDETGGVYADTKTPGQWLEPVFVTWHDSASEEL